MSSKIISAQFCSFLCITHLLPNLFLAHVDRKVFHNSLGLSYSKWLNGSHLMPFAITWDKRKILEVTNPESKGASDELHGVKLFFSQFGMQKLEAFGRHMAAGSFSWNQYWHFVAKLFIESHIVFLSNCFKYIFKFTDTSKPQSKQQGKFAGLQPTPSKVGKWVLTKFYLG